MQQRKQHNLVFILLQPNKYQLIIIGLVPTAAVLSLRINCSLMQLQQLWRFYIFNTVLNQKFYPQFCLSACTQFSFEQHSICIVSQTIGSVKYSFVKFGKPLHGTASGIGYLIQINSLDLDINSVMNLIIYNYKRNKKIHNTTHYNNSLFSRQGLITTTMNSKNTVTDSLHNTLKTREIDYTLHNSNKIIIILVLQKYYFEYSLFYLNYLFIMWDYIYYVGYENLMFWYVLMIYMELAWDITQYQILFYGDIIYNLQLICKTLFLIDYLLRNSIAIISIIFLYIL